MYQVDAIAALELFDSDQFFQNPAKTKAIKTKKGKNTAGYVITLTAKWKCAQDLGFMTM
ncbi:hypothetical protein MASR1M65_07030 [Saprospiraceae bacterium]